MLVGWLGCWPTGWLACWLADQLTCCMIEWRARWSQKYFPLCVGVTIQTRLTIISGIRKTMRSPAHGCGLYRRYHTAKALHRYDWQRMNGWHGVTSPELALLSDQAFLALRPDQPRIYEKQAECTKSFKFRPLPDAPQHLAVAGAPSAIVRAPPHHLAVAAAPSAIVPATMAIVPYTGDSAMVTKVHSLGVLHLGAHTDRSWSTSGQIWS